MNSIVEPVASTLLGPWSCVALGAGFLAFLGAGLGAQALARRRRDRTWTADDRAWLEGQRIAEGELS